MLDRTSDPQGTNPIPLAELAAWIVVNTHPHKESMAIENLHRQYYTTYCPMIRARVRHARRSMDVLRPLFPNYLFVAVDSDRERWRPILSTFGVRTVVRDGDKPSRLDARIIVGLKAREIAGAVVRPPNPYRIGQDVKMAGGALDGLVAKIIALDEKDRIVVLLDLLNRPVKARVTIEQVRAF